MRPETPENGDAPNFPVFINIRRARAFIAGGGKVAARRAETLLSFGAAVEAASPEACPELTRLSDREGFRWTRDVYRPEYLDGAVLAIAATDDREVNRQVGLDARARGILVSVADRREECTFYFPAVMRSDFLTAGLVSNNGDHRMVRSAAAKLLDAMETIDEDYQGGKPRKPVGDGAGAAGDGCDSGR